ncbi:MAG: hypothetical protein J5J06_09430 [Phycisphaerae bacterium]|nr:hypothetical protein [Phycisphaerae bacterium]
MDKIVFTCECGKSVTVDRKFAGRRGRCPRCNAVVQIPADGPAVGHAAAPGPSPVETTRSMVPDARSRSLPEVLPARMRANRLIAGKLCSICQTALAVGDEVRNCEHCRSSFHASCWQEAEGCGTYGCQNSPAAARANTKQQPATLKSEPVGGAPIEGFAVATRAALSETSPPRIWRSRTIRSVLIVAGIVVLGAVGFVALRNNELRTKLAKCSSRSGIMVRVYYGSYLSTNDVVFDLRGVEGSSVRRIDPVHLLLQFGQLLDKQATRRLILARDGRLLMYLRSSDLSELANEYTHGNPMWSFNHLPERLKTMSGNNAYPTWEGGWLGVLKGQSEDLNQFITDWTGC